jgi:DNA modification methylase
MNYDEFLAAKLAIVPAAGIKVQDADIHPALFQFQRDMVRWACGKGRAAIFADTGLGKTYIQLEWARLMGKRTLIVAPLSVARQTARMANDLGIKVRYVRSGIDLPDDGNLFITNYEMLDNFNAADFGAVVLDESSILKGLDGKTRKRLTEMFSETPYRLCCTATPAPNDHIELGNHAEFLGICTRAEMLARFFINANKEHQLQDADGRFFRRKGSNKGGQEWRLKHHAEKPFYRWLATWAMTIVKPSDLDYDDDGFILPELTITPHFVPTDYIPEGELFFTHMHGVADRHTVRRGTAENKVAVLLDLLEKGEGQWIIWCGLEAESRMLASLLPQAIEVAGADSPEFKAQAFEDFQDGKYRVLITKPRIGGFGMNFQNAHHMAFFGLSDSWEAYYQCIRREYRYRQEFPVDVHTLLADVEEEIWHNIQRKDNLNQHLRAGLLEAMKDYEKEEIMGESNVEEEYQEDTVTGNGFTALLGDSCLRLKELEENSVDLSVYSPPFADLYTYSASDHDLGNNCGWGQFFNHYAFIIREVLRVTKPGRLTCVHTSDIPAMSQRDGYIGIKDFPGEVIRAYEKEGWVFTGRAFVQKNPQAQAIRTKSKGLLFVQLAKDSSDSRPALIDQVLIFKKPGDNAVPVTPVQNGEMDNETWIEWAHGIWIGIQETDTLQYSTARAADDEKHICPLQLGTIERCVKLYSNPGEMILSPFMGIGSEGYVARRLGRRFVGIELKPSYFEIAVKNLRLVTERKQMTLFDLLPQEALALEA